MLPHLFTFDKNRQNIYKNKSPCESKDISIFSRFFHFFSSFFQLVSKRQSHTTLDMTGFEPIFINFAFFLNKNKIWDSSKLLLQTRFCCSKKLFINSLSTLKQQKQHNWLLIKSVQLNKLLLNLEQQIWSNGCNLWYDCIIIFFYKQCCSNLRKVKVLRSKKSVEEVKIKNKKIYAQ